MNVLIPHSWLSEYCPGLPRPADVARRLSVCGPSIEKIIEDGSDALYDAEITTNRPDLYALIGFARETAAILGLKWKERFDPAALKKNLDLLSRHTKSGLLSVRIEEPRACPRYTGMMIANVTNGSSPEWMQKRLIQAGQRPINAIVDITNYVMLEYGQPMHAFDASKVVTNTPKGEPEEERREIVVRPAVQDEEFTSLDGETKKLDSTMLVIADHAGPLALAGIKGGSRARVTADTHTIILESATFDPLSVRTTGRVVDIRTDSSARFEKGLSSELPPFALARAAQLVIELCGGAPLSPFVDQYPKKEKEVSIHFSPSHLSRVLGIDIPLPSVKKGLTTLGFNIQTEKKVWAITIPFWRRADVEKSVDIVEEAARLYGYDRVPLESVRTPIPMTARDDSFAWERETKRLLRDSGFHECMHYSFVSGTHLERAGIDPRTCVRVVNPLSLEFEFMRTSLVPDLLETTASNEQRSDALSFFELSTVYHPTAPDALPDEHLQLTAIIARRVSATVLVREIKGALGHILSGILGSNVSAVSFSPLQSDSQWCNSGEGLVLMVTGKEIGTVGLLSNAVRERYGIQSLCGFFDFSFAVLAPLCSRVPRFTPLPKYPTVVRDVAFVVSNESSYTTLEKALVECDPLITDMSLFDIFENAKLGEGKRSLAFRLTYSSPDRTLLAEEVDAVHEKVRAMLQNKFSAELR